MTDRDYFAAAALTGLLFHNHEPPMPVRWWVEQAYDYADAMLRERAESYDESDEKCCDSNTIRTALTDAEREAVECALIWVNPERQATLRGLLERLGGDR